MRQESFRISMSCALLFYITHTRQRECTGRPVAAQRGAAKCLIRFQFDLMRTLRQSYIKLYLLAYHCSTTSCGFFFIIYDFFFFCFCMDCIKSAGNAAAAVAATALPASHSNLNKLIRTKTQRTRQNNRLHRPPPLQCPRHAVYSVPVSSLSPLCIAMMILM